MVDADIRRYFDEVDHQLLMAEVKKLVTDEGILKLIQQWLDAVIVDAKSAWHVYTAVGEQA